MPDRATIEAATPRCRRTRVKPHDSNPRSGVHELCLQPMRYHAAADAWSCDCGAILPAADLRWERAAA